MRQVEKRKFSRFCVTQLSKVCRKRNSLIWVKILNGTHDAGFPRQSLNARFSCWHKFATDTNISCIHSYIWEYVAMRKRYMETSFISLIKSCLNGQETRLCSISYTWSRMSMSFSSFSCSNKVKTPYRSAISALLQLGHEVTPKFRENNLLCITCFRTNFEKKQQLWKAASLFYISRLSTKYSQFVVNGYFRIRFNFCRSSWLCTV